MPHIMFVEPLIPGNTGNAIRLAAVTGCHLHLVEPLGFNFEDANLRRAGLDYHDLADTTVHPDIDAALAAVPDSRVFAFTGKADGSFADIEYREKDVLLFGREDTGLPDSVLNHPRITQQVRIPMLPARRSLNLANSASIAVYEAWRQRGFSGGV
ncbi:tRNA (cytidine(34)-2'-O)-methyltransferase [Helcobacillus sp. ACRRO]|uniref:tRNA (cytidine(34)-2'-O)-methyltransferase n=1 Tax=Helcobacillus sp. ACRRO TaxID=2918202 RepID=UPI001EF52C5D|nr:tRNA (cytidine(34)-2'-O)-methyltransferase [Helcobacillus sp. ACRRO]MCG7427332.1 tRNA (cytidine(34)-2'-O)-methyltransferase [Helcobacillus sp. ACRRO]